MENTDLTCPEHDHHLCYLTNLHFHQTNWMDYKKLVEDAHYVCSQCGRSASDKNRLCQPVKL